MKYVQLIIKTPERRQCLRSGVFIVNFTQFSVTFIADFKYVIIVVNYSAQKYLLQEYTFKKKHKNSISIFL